MGTKAKSKKAVAADKAAKAVRDNGKDKVKVTTIHYHHDTKPIHDTLTKGKVYKTSKGTGRYQGRSWSNGKLLFVGTENQNIYFTAKEWMDGNNKASNMDTMVEKKMETERNERLEAATRGFIPMRTRLINVDNNQTAIFEGITINGIKVRYTDGARAVFYFNAMHLNSFFDVDTYDIGEAEEKRLAMELKKLKEKGK